MFSQSRRNWLKISLTGSLYLIVLMTISLQSPSSSFTWLITPIIFGISFIDWFATKVKTVVDVNLYASTSH